MNHAERQRLKDFERGKKIMFKMWISWREINKEDATWYVELWKKHERNWHIIMRKINKELDDE